MICSPLSNISLVSIQVFEIERALQLVSDSRALHKSYGALPYQLKRLFIEETALVD